MSSASSAGLSETVLAAPNIVDAGPQELPASTFEMRPNPRNTFKGALVKEIIGEVVNDTLRGQTYAASRVADWLRSIADDINVRCKELKMRRYRHVVQVALAQQNGAGCKYVARCRWDAECDSQVTSYFSNETMVCVVSVFGVYLY